MRWNPIAAIESMSWLGQGVVYVLLGMFAISTAVLLNRGVRYAAARRQSRNFIKEVAGPFRDGELEDIVSIAKRNPRSHIATVIAEGVTSFQSAAPSLSSSQSIALAQAALERSSTTVLMEMKTGLSGIATIASTAPFVGLFGIRSSAF